jgi:predicted GNAT family acetyltransferase
MKISELINPQTRQGDFKDQQEINGLVYSADSETEEYKGKTYTKLHITVHNKQGKRMGYAWFALPDNDAGAMTCSFITVPDELQKQGIAKTMYAYARQLGNSIERSSAQLSPGKAMWASWDKSGFSKELAEELNLQKGKWELLLTAADKQEAGPELVNLVGRAYSNTAKGSMIQSLRDVVPSDWEVIDWDQDPDIDACIFYRKPRGNETWVGHKLQGLGHDGSRTSKHKAIEHILQLLAKPGVWIESSDALRYVLNKMNAPAITDLVTLQRLFNDSQLEMVDSNTYVRTLQDGTKIKETVFGHPRLK